LLSTENQYAYLRTSPEEQVLVVLNRAGAEKPLELEVDDLPLPDGVSLRSLVPGISDVSVSGGKVMIEHPAPVQIYRATQHQ
jgi:hypothetical protein